jgi:hypothetical protein
MTHDGTYSNLYSKATTGTHKRTRCTVKRTQFNHKEQVCHSCTGLKMTHDVTYSHLYSKSTTGTHKRTRCIHEEQVCHLISRNKEKKAIQHLQYVLHLYSISVLLWQQMSYRASLEPILHGLILHGYKEAHCL